MTLDQDFPISIETQMLGGLKEGENRPTASVCTPGTNVVMSGELITNHCISSNSETYYGDQWVNLEVTVLRDSIITHKINGNEVLSYMSPQIGGNLDEYSSEWQAKSGELFLTLMKSRCRRASKNGIFHSNLDNSVLNLSTKNLF